ncbi:Mce protein [Mycobacterium aquaticum]|uniref:Mce protein n=1 Tax=Mycobacterium aquaticum TaxID=1927124 RepID=A0A1X0B401_9MYCO|nr:Mce protein [Mycobacterium aquaticum]ORA37057.1 Mce protein [Mycobacterium aquaticum]
MADDSADAQESAQDVHEPDTQDSQAAAAAESSGPRMSQLRLAALAGAAIVVALVAATAWLGFRAVQTHRADEKRQMFLDAGRQAALTLTNVDWEHADDDVQRVLDSASGQFYDDFERRSQSYLAVVKQAKSKAVGTITASALVSASDHDAQVMVSMTVNSSNAGVAGQAQSWRMVLRMQENQGVTKVSNVDFIQ